MPKRRAPSPMYAQTVASQQHRAFYKAGGTDVLAGLRHFDTAKKPCLTARASRCLRPRSQQTTQPCLSDRENGLSLLVSPRPSTPSYSERE